MVENTSVGSPCIAHRSAKLASVIRREGPIPLAVGLFGSVTLVLLAEGLQIPAAATAPRQVLTLTTLALAAQGVPIAGLSAFVCGVIGWRRPPPVAAAAAIMLGVLSLLRILPTELLAMLVFVPARSASCSERTWVRWLWLCLAVASAVFGLSVWRYGTSSPLTSANATPASAGPGRLGLRAPARPARCAPCARP